MTAYLYPILGGLFLFFPWLRPYPSEYAEADYLA